MVINKIYHAVWDTAEEKKTEGRRRVRAYGFVIIHITK
jgi:hypothetical protein